MIVLFSAISILLIYSLLMITVEQKAYESAIMRLLGLNKFNYTVSILMQALFFVLPSIVLGYIAALPTLHYLIAWLFKGKQ